MIYLAGWSLLYYALIMQRVTRYGSLLFGVIAIILIALIVVFRGQTGTDTFNYEIQLMRFSIGDFRHAVEPAFTILGVFLTHITDEPATAVRGIAVLFILLILIYYINAHEDERFIFLSYFGPLYLYSYGMNGLRIGIAAALFLLGTQMLRRGRNTAAGILFFSSLLFHYTILLPITWILISYGARLRWWQLVLFGALIFAVILNAGEHVTIRVEGYAVHGRPSAWSGVSSLIVVVTLLGGVRLSALSYHQRVSVSLWIISLVGLVTLASFESYAALRLLDLIVLTTPLVILRSHDLEGKTLNRALRFSFVVAGALGAANQYRGFLLEASRGGGMSPFLPYRTLWSSG